MLLNIEFIESTFKQGPRGGQGHKHKRIINLQCDQCAIQFVVKYHKRHLTSFNFCCRQCFYVARKTIVQKQVRETCIKKYGGTCPFASAAVRLKAEHTMIKKYGAKNSSQATEVAIKIKKTRKERYGNNHPSRRANISKIEQVIVDQLRNQFISIDTQLLVNETWSVDAYVTDLDTYIEIDGTYWHRLNQSVDELVANYDIGGLTKRLRDLEQNEWFEKHHKKLLRIDEATARIITATELKDLIESCKPGVTLTFNYILD